MRIALVEDHPVVRRGLKTVLETQPDMTVIGEVADPADALTVTTKTRPDIVILALRLGGELRGVEICREIKNLPDAPAVLVYSAFNTDGDIASSFLSGADGYVYKGEDSEQLLRSVRDAAAGVRNANELRKLIEESGLTPKERDVLGLVLQRFTNGQIAERLYIELSTVKTHVRSILRKLGISSREELFS